MALPMMTGFRYGTLVLGMQAQSVSAGATGTRGEGGAMRYRLQLLGRPELSSDKHSMLPTSRKGQALIFYLAANSGQAFSRSHLSSLLWCDHSNERARHNFNMMMSRLRNELL